MRSWSWEVIKIVRKEFLKNMWKCLFLFHERNKWKCLLLFHDWFSLEFVFRYNIFAICWEINSKQSICTGVKQKKIKSSRNEYVMWTCFKFWPIKNIFRKLWANESLIMACLQIYRELLSLATFLRVHSNSKEVSYLPWQNAYPNLKTTCHIKLKFFLWTKLLENLLIVRYLISVAAPLS